MAMTVSAEELSTVIGSIYDCAIDPAAWERTLGELRAVFRCASAQLAAFDLTQRRAALVRSSGIEPLWLEQQQRHVAEFTEWEKLAFGRYGLSIDEPQVRSRHLPPEMAKTSPYVREWNDPQGIVDSLGLVILQTPTRHAQIGMGRHRDIGLIAESDVELAKFLIPHIRRSVTISDILDMRSLETSHAHEMLDSLAAGVFLVDDEARIIHSNAAADKMLATRSSVRCISGRLAAELPAATRELRAAITLATQDEAKLGHAGLAVRTSPPGDPPILAHVLPLFRRPLQPPLQGNACAAVFVRSLDEDPLGTEALAVAYDLTAAETRVLTGILRGMTLTASAAHLGIARSSAKTHLDSIFSKTGVARQVDLAVLAARLASPAVSLG